MNKNIFILGINSVYHDSSACIIKNGKIIAAAEEERFNRIKYGKKAEIYNSGELPKQAIDFCLRKAKIKLRDVDHIAFSFYPKDRLKNINCSKYFTKGSWGTKKGEELFYKNTLSVPKRLSELAGVDMTKKFHWVKHHEAHAASSFFVSPHKKSIVIAVDGIGEFASAWLGYGDGNKLHKIKEVDFPNSIGFLWEKMSEFLGFTAYDSGKVMGLSSYGDWKVYYKNFHNIIDFDEKNIFTLNNDIMKLRTDDFSKIEQVFNMKKRVPGSKISKEHEHVAAALQKMTEKLFFRLVTYTTDRVKDKETKKNLCGAGGVLLNCVANQPIFFQQPFEDFFVPSSPSDGGTSIGAAFYVYHQVLNKKRTFVYNHPYWGPEYSDEEIQKVLKSSGLQYKKINHIEKKAAKLIADGNIVAWFQGKLEFGPRALGNRSILADPRKKDMMDIINKKVKRREYFRPFAPSVLEEKMKDHFYMVKSLLSDRFMLFTLTPKRPEKLPAITHIDETSRIQAVSKKVNPKYHKLISEFEKITGFPVVLNTSFNIQEPIICSPEDAIKTFLKSKIDYLVIGNYLCEKNNKHTL